VDDEMAKAIVTMFWTGYSENADLKQYFLASEKGGCWNGLELKRNDGI
jgi:hypothetical protein